MQIKVISLFVILLLSISPSAFAYEPSGITQCLKKNYTQSRLQSLIHKTVIIGEDESKDYWYEGPAGPYNKTDWIYKLKELHEKRYGAAGGIKCYVNGKRMEIGSATLTEDCQFITTKEGNFFNKDGKKIHNQKNCSFVYVTIHPKAKTFKNQFKEVNIPLDYKTMYRPKKCRGKVGAILGIALKSCARKIPIFNILSLEDYSKHYLKTQRFEILPSIQIVKGKPVESTRYARGEILETDVHIKDYSCKDTSVIHNADITQGGSGAGLLLKNELVHPNIIIGIHHTGRQAFDEYNNRMPHLDKNLATIFTLHDENAIKKIVKKIKTQRFKNRQKK